MSNRVVISDKVLEERIAEAFRDSKFKETPSPQIVVSSHPVNPLTHDELVEKLNIAYDFTNGVGYPDIIKEELDKGTDKSVKRLLLIIYKHKLVWKLYHSKDNWFGASYKVEDDGKVIFDFKFVNNVKILT